MSEKLIVIGSGPAGLTAALYAARAELNPLLIEGYDAGGQLMLTTEVENYPGFPDAIMGPELMGNFRKQAERFGTRILTTQVTRVDFSSRPLSVWTGGDEYETQAVIVATGASALWLDVPGEEHLRGRGVSACATCDGFFFKGKNLIVVGGGDSAMEEALFLTKFAEHVTIVHRRAEFRASKIMATRVMDNPKIDVIWDTVVDEIVGPDVVTAAQLRNVKTDRVKEVPIDGIFVAIGHRPNTDLFQGRLKLDQKGYIVLRGDGSTHTSVEGVFAAGDVTDHIYRQAVTAAGSGCQAAIDAERWLAHH
ncbi:MAG TPA: thioredoxin-disulfide reductase [Acidimicrobiia bacterium]